MSQESQTFPRAEETLRLLAAAAGAARLYPPTSELPAQAVSKFTRRANEVTASHGPLRFTVDPDGFRIGDEEIAGGANQVSALAKSLHALQVGQVVIAPGLSDIESMAFVTIANAEPNAVRAVGGPRAVLGSAQVTHIAVLEVSLRASDEEGLAGIDLMTSPVDDIAEQLEGAAEKWGGPEGTGEDHVAGALNRLEAAARGLAAERVAAAMMRLPEATRRKILGLALHADNTGRRMDGMLEVIAQMKPAALARLLTLVATQAETDPNRIAAALPIPAEKVAELRRFLSPSRPPSFGEEPPPDAQSVAAEMSRPEDEGDLRRQVSVASPQLSAGRALGTAVAVSRVHPDPESIRAIGDTLPKAAVDGSFQTVREALRRLDELAASGDLQVDVGAARGALADPKVLVDVCSAVMTDADAAIVGEVLHSAGPAGAEALLETFIRGGGQQRSLLRPALRGMSDSVLGVARSRLRNEEPARAVAILATLSQLGDRRAIPVMSEATAHLDERVRFAAITALADTPEPEAANALVRVLGHSEPETQRFAIREIGRVRAAPAVHQLTRALEDLNVLQRTHETKKEVIRALTRIGTPEAQRALRGTADRGFVLTRKSKELRRLAKRALDDIRAAQEDAAREGME